MTAPKPVTLEEMIECASGIISGLEWQSKRLRADAPFGALAYAKATREMRAILANLEAQQDDGR